MNNLFFLSGPHGSGKTTLVRILEKEIPEVLNPVLYTRTCKFFDSDRREIDFFQRQILKHAQRAIENYEYQTIAEKNPERIVLGNRCLYDVKCYHQAYFDLGWMNEEQKRVLDNEFYFQAFDGLIRPNAIVLNPGFEVCRRHLEKRWMKDKKKFCEDNMDYLKRVCQTYEGLQDEPNVLYMDHEIDLGSLRDGLEIRDWVYDRFYQPVG